MPVQAIAYVRYSTITQKDGDSYGRQTNPLEVFEQREGVKITEIVTDDGVSAYTGRNVTHGNFGQILDKIRCGELGEGDYIVAESVDRISRQTLQDTTLMLNEILKAGLAIHTTNDQHTYRANDQDNNFTNYVKLGIYAELAHQESEQKSRRLKSVWSQRRKDAREGKVFNKNTKLWGIDYENGQFVINEEEAKEIRDLFEYLQFMGMQKAVKKLNETSKRTWNLNLVYRMFENKYVIGIYRAQGVKNGKKNFIEEIPDYYPKIIDDSTFHKVVKIMKDRSHYKRSGNERNANVNIFRHVIFCRECGRSMVLNKSNGYIYLTCKSNHVNDEDYDCARTKPRFDHVLASFIDGLEATFHIQKLGILKNYSEQEQKAHSLLYELTRTEKPEESEELKKLEREYHEAVTEYDRWQESIEDWIKNRKSNPPSFMYDNMELASISLEEKKEKLDIENGKPDSPVLGVRYFEDFVRLLKTEEGRLKVNKFFLDNGFTFRIGNSRDYGTRTVVVETWHNDEFTTLNERTFKSRNDGYLRMWGMLNFNESEFAK
jgi:DNA invertase Pin-like site-specific DNA recombinase